MTVDDPSVVTAQVVRPAQPLPGLLTTCNKEGAAGRESSPAVKCPPLNSPLSIGTSNETKFVQIQLSTPDPWMIHVT